MPHGFTAFVHEVAKDCEIEVDEIQPALVAWLAYAIVASLPLSLSLALSLSRSLSLTLPYSHSYQMPLRS